MDWIALISLIVVAFLYVQANEKRKYWKRKFDQIFKESAEEYLKLESENLNLKNQIMEGGEYE